MPAFPTSMDQLSVEWLSHALGYEVNSFSVEPLGEGGGLIGMVTRVTLDTKEGPDTLIAKFPTQAPENRAVAETYDMYGREYSFYTQIAPTVPIRAPRCYHAAFNPANSDFVLLLEDLQGFIIGDQVASCSLDEAHQVIETMAALHRNTWQPDRIKDIKQHDVSYQREGMKFGFQAGWPNVQSNFSHLLDPELIDCLGRMPANIDALLDRLHQGPLVIAHGDLRLDNVFFSDQGIALVDFQAVCKAAPEHDLAYFVTQSLSDDVRNAEDWHQVYFKHLTSEGINYDAGLSRERYLHAALYFVCYAVIIAGTLDTANDRGMKLAETLLGNSLRSQRELNTLDLIN